jgi:histidinol-phosphate phosphatase family protein
MRVAPSGDGSPRPLRSALFIDRDGTLNPDLHYLKDAERIELFAGVGAALRLAHAHGWLVICVTNQSGVERGFYTVEDVERIHARVNALLAREGAQVDAFYYCPHAPEHGCACRKPKTELFERACRDWSIDPATSAIVGDRVLDAEAGQRLGLLTARVRTPAQPPEVDAEFVEHGIVPEVTADSVEGAVLRLLSRG